MQRKLTQLICSLMAVMLYVQGPSEANAQLNGTLEVTNFGFGRTLPVPGDYDGDGITDEAVYDPLTATWYLNRSQSGFVQQQFGFPGVTPVPADYNDDGVTDIAVYIPGAQLPPGYPPPCNWEPGRWYVRYSPTQTLLHKLYSCLGGNFSVPVPGDYDGDFITDLMVYDSLTAWWSTVRRATHPFYTDFSGLRFGFPGVTPVPADYNGDRMTDIAVYHLGTWYKYLLPPVANWPPAMVTVGDAGNADNTRWCCGYSIGAVAYEYKIGKYEVTNAEYVKFLNAVDPTGENTLALYNTSMNTDIRGGISKDASAVNGFKYVVKPGCQKLPVVFVSLYDAMRFCNWLHNGAVNGGDTEDGAYTLLGGTAMPSNLTTVERNPGAKFAVPTEDEWYKAAHYDPVNAGADADGNLDYWDYPTMSDTTPTREVPTGDPNSANWNDVIGNVTVVGAYSGSPSYYGTFDQGGNVEEWTATPTTIWDTRLKPSMWGGSWSHGTLDNIGSDDPFDGSFHRETSYIGFRIVSP